MSSNVDMSATVVRDARREDLEGVTALLHGASLPTLGVTDHFENFLVAENHGSVLGAIGLELYGETALLRSAVVSPENRNLGLGSRLYEALLLRARSLGVHRLILLTNTAEQYFQRKGFRKIDQSTVTGPVTTSVEFTGACPSHAACMEMFL